MMTAGAIAGLSLSAAAWSKQSNPSSAEVANRPRLNEHSSYHGQIFDQIWRIKNGQETIYGHIYRPVKFAGQEKVAVLSHGLGGNYEQMTAYVKNLAQRGYFAYAFDFPGGSLGRQSTNLRRCRSFLKKKICWQ